MNGVHFHLIMNHVPALGLMFGLMLLGVGLIRRNTEFKSLALLAIIFSALFTVPVNVSGERAEEIVEGLAGRSHELIHEHEESAEWALWMMLGVAGVAGGPGLCSEMGIRELIFSPPSPSDWAFWFLFG